MAQIPLSPAARGLVRELAVFDAHVDSLQRMTDLGHDLGVRGPGQLDLVRGREGGLGAVVLVAWVDPAYLPDRSFARAAALIASAHELAARYPEQLRLVANGAELAAARRDGVTAAVPGIEGGHAIEESLEKLRWFHARGLRVMTLVWNNHLRWIRSCRGGAGAEIPEGLSDFGRAVVREMNRLGILIDLSHAGERSFYDVLEESSKPVIASHSGCAALHQHARNLSDDQLRALRDHGGVLGVVFHPGFLDRGAEEEEARVRASDAYRALRAEGETALFVAQSEHLRAHASPLDASRVADHVLHAVEIAGIDHVGLGSDFDGIQRGPRGLDDASCYGRLADLLLERGLDVAAVRKVLGGNMARVFSEATAGACGAS